MRRSVVLMILAAFSAFAVETPAPPVLAFIHAKVYPTPDAAPLPDATVLVEGGRIRAVGRGIAIPTGAKVLDCQGRPLMAGFWNCHAHLTQPKWDDAATAPAARMAAQFQEMFTRFGFTSVVDLGSNPGST
ncbi:MAG: hypothetical protein HY014_02815 [Acidobacteria bacterium]|nr:hypothetical protein [Acidobacteriota bacterium]MBI3487082.1 hypothetical protein [Acidobacteriota bacterium]